MNKFEYAMPQDIPQALSSVQHSGAVFKAGGVDLLDLMKEGIIAPSRLVHINNIEALKVISRTKDGGLALGANLTIAEIAELRELSGAHQALPQAAGSTATPQIRNLATLGGNLCQETRCWYFRDQNFSCSHKGGSQCFALQGENYYHALFDNKSGCVRVNASSISIALVALGAKLRITSAESSRDVSVAEFLVAPSQDIEKTHILERGEIIEAIILPASKPHQRSFYYKQKEKQSFDWPVAEVAVSWVQKGGVCENPTVILGAAAPTPWRSKKAEAVLAGQKITKKLAEKAAQAAMSEATPLSQNANRAKVFEAVIARVISWAGGVDPLQEGK